MYFISVVHALMVELTLDDIYYDPWQRISMNTFSYHPKVISFLVRYFLYAFNARGVGY